MALEGNCTAFRMIDSDETLTWGVYTLICIAWAYILQVHGVLKFICDGLIMTCMNGWIGDRWMDWFMDGWMDGWIDGLRNRLMGTFIYIYIYLFITLTLPCFIGVYIHHRIPTWFKWIIVSFYLCIWRKGLHVVRSQCSMDVEFKSHAIQHIHLPNTLM